MVVYSKSGSFTYDYVRLKPCRQIDLHTQKTWELDYIQTGSGVRTIGDRQETFREGEVVLVPPEIPHCWNFDPAGADPDGNIVNITLTFDDLMLDSILRVFPQMREVVDRLLEMRDTALFYSGKTRASLAAALTAMRTERPSAQAAEFMNILNLLGDTAGISRSEVYRRMSVEQTREMQVRVFVSSNLSRRITLKEMAAYVGMNEAAFCVFFKRHYGQTFIEYLNSRRLEHARYLLEKGGLSVAEVCYASGFESPAYFSRLFRKSTGTSPSAYAKSVADNHLTIS